MPLIDGNRERKHVDASKYFIVKNVSEYPETVANSMADLVMLGCSGSGVRR